jgi:hypothetical protein
MKANARCRMGEPKRQRKIGAWGARLTLLALALVACPGCQGLIGQLAKEGALTIVENTVDSVINLITGAIDAQILGLGSGQ